MPFQDSRPLLLNTLALADDIIFYVTLHERPIKSLPCQVGNFVSADMPHVIMKVFEHKRLQRIRENQLSVLSGLSV